MTEEKIKAALEELKSVIHPTSDEIYGGSILSNDGLHIVLSKDCVDVCVALLEAQTSAADALASAGRGEEIDGAISIVNQGAPNFSFYADVPSFSDAYLKFTEALQTVLEAARRYAASQQTRGEVPEGYAIVPSELIDVAMNSPELNPINYDHDQVCELNRAMCEICAMLTTSPTPPVAGKDRGEADV